MQIFKKDFSVDMYVHSAAEQQVQSASHSMTPDSAVLAGIENCGHGVPYRRIIRPSKALVIIIHYQGQVLIFFYLKKKFEVA